MNPDEELRATGGISAPSELLLTSLRYFGAQEERVRSALPQFSATRGGLVFVKPGLGPLMGEAAERWEREQARKDRERQRQARIERDFCLCSRRNVGYDDDYEADWRRVRPASGYCPVHGTTDELDHWDD